MDCLRYWETQEARGKNCYNLMISCQPILIWQSNPIHKNSISLSSAPLEQA
ncbi:hypothetical protein RintRC_4492 [Richelia intracellularis]|nr:hypothetical protein RintRC_4492 [Richelia intracellularis]